MNVIEGPLKFISQTFNTCPNEGDYCVLVLHLDRQSPNLVEDEERELEEAQDEVVRKEK